MFTYLRIDDHPQVSFQNDAPRHIFNLSDLSHDAKHLRFSGEYPTSLIPPLKNTSPIC